MKALLESFLGALFGQIVEAINAWRRDKALEELGYTKAQRDLAAGALDEANRARAARDDVERRRAADPNWLPSNDPNRLD